MPLSVQLLALQKVMSLILHRQLLHSRAVRCVSQLKQKALAGRIGNYSRGSVAAPESAELVKLEQVAEAAAV